MMYRDVEIEIIRHAETGLFLAMSNDLKGLYVHARTIGELNARIPVAISDILTSQGVNVVSVEAHHESDSDASFLPIKKKFHLQEAA